MWLGQPMLTDQRDVPDNMMSCLAVKAGEEEGRTFGLRAFVCPSNCYA